MKVIHLISGGDVGGAKTHVLSLLAGLNTTETVHLVCFTEGEFAAEARQLGIPTTVLADKNLRRVRKRILAMLRHDGYQIIHCHGARANMMGMLLRKRAGIPVISTIHSDYRLDYMGRALAALTYGNVNKIALRCFDGWIGVSSGMTQLLISRGFNPQKIYTIYNGVDFSAPCNPLPREDYLRTLGVSLPENGVLFGIAARISPVKDMTTLLHAFAQAQKQCPQIRLVIAGDGEQAEQIKALAKELCSEGTVCFAGWLSDIDSFYNALDVNLLTSLSEAFPYALPEGARMRCATIASEVGGVPSLIDDGINGLLFQPRDIETLREHMVFLAQNSDIRRRMSDLLYEKTKRDFSLDAMLTTQKQIYQTVLRRASHSENERRGVLICGAYGKGNSGDNAILSAIISQLRHIDPDLPICALSRSPKETRQQAGIDAIYTFNVWKAGRRLRKTKLYISGGGTLMQDATSTRSLLFYLFSIRQAYRKACRVMLYGCGIGPISRPRNRRRAQKTLERCAHVISVRDLYSEQELQALGVSRPEIHVSADPALLIDPPGADKMQNYLRRCGIEPEKKYALFAVRPWTGFAAKTAAFAQAAEYVSREYGLIPVLFSMEPARDEAASQAIAEQLHCPHLTLCAGSDGEKLLSLIRRMSLVVAMRLHTLVFAAGQGVPMVGVVYDPKVSGFLDYLGQDAYLPLTEVSASALADLIDAALAEKPFEQENIRRLRALSTENEALARRLLEL